MLSRWLSHPAISCLLLAAVAAWAVTSLPSWAQESGNTPPAGGGAAAGSETPPDTPPTGGSAAKGGGGTTDSGTPDGGGDPAAGQAAAAAPPANPNQPTGWLKVVDDAFGRYLVGPLYTVIFYDFGTGSLLGEKSRIPFVVAWLLFGAVFFTIRMGFINFRAWWHAVELTRGDYDDPTETGEVTHFQALSSALSATVGLGNIAGVAIAVSTGGPGATFWMIVVGLLGMTSKFTECTLGQMYRKVDKDGTVLGGPMQYLKDGLSEMGLGPLGVALSTVFAVVCMGAALGGGNAFQVGQSLAAIKQEVGFLQEYPGIYGVVMAFGAGLVIIGGIKSIGAVAGRIVPLMCGAYVLAALYILGANIAKVPAAFSLILQSAFTPEAQFGGFIGVLVTGITRAVFSNEAGVGSAAIAHSAAKTNEPVSEGIVALLEPFIDTVVVCTMTALVIVITGVWNSQDPKLQAMIASEEGAALTAEAFKSGGYEWFKWILYSAVVLFAFSTLISWSYYGERCWVYLFGARSSIVYKCIFLFFTVLGSLVTAVNVKNFSDLLILGLAFPNILGVLILSGKVRRALDDYWGKYQRGELAKGHGSDGDA